MSKILLRLAGASSLALALGAAPFWEAADPADWTAGQLNKILSDSPWAKTARVEFVGDPGGTRSPPGAERPDSRRGPSIPGVGGVPGVGGLPGGVGLPGTDGGWGGQGPVFRYSEDSPFDGDPIIRWRGALPIRQALARKAYGSDSIDQAEAARLLVERPPGFVIEITGLPPAMAHAAEDPVSLMSGARLLFKDGSTAPAERVEVLPRPGAPGLLLAFPRRESIAEDAGWVEFQLSTEQYRVSRRFKLKAMVYRGRLEL